MGLDGDRTLVMHLRMTGNLILREGDEMLDPSEGRRLYESERSTEERHLRARFVLDDGRELWFTDPRRFGEAFLIDDDERLAERFAKLGVEPFSPEFTPRALGEMAAGRTAPLKSFLLDQSKVAGVGNIYADEALFRAELHPLSPAGSMKPEHLEALRDAVVAALEAGIDAGGSSIDDYRDARGEKGSMQDEFLVHTREGEDCPRCDGDDRPHRRRRPLDLLLPSLPGQTAAPSEAPGAIVRPIGHLWFVAGTTVKTEAIVLRSIRYGEADRILHLYSKSRGRIGAIAKGARKPKSRFGGRLEPFFRLDLMLHEGRSDLMTVTSATTVDGYPRLRSSGARPHRRRPRLRRGPAPARRRRAEPARLQPALPLPGAARRPGRAPRRRPRRRRSPSGSSWRWSPASPPSSPPAPTAARPSTWSASPAPPAGSSAPAAKRAPSRSARRRTGSWSRRWRSRSARPRRPSCRRCARSSGQLAKRSSTTRTCSCARPLRLGLCPTTVHAFEDRDRLRLEEEFLAPEATRSYPARRQREEENSPLRTPFQRDRDRIVHSKSFRRLKHKTQVFVAPEGDHYRTRLTHTLEACGIARTVARALRLNEDLTEAIGLGHDLGHPPFGHAGEEALDAALRDAGGDGFRHNEHSLRVVDVLEREGEGLNLTEQVRDGILNHTGSRKPATLEGQIVKLVDRVAYINHDIDDALRAGILRPEDLPGRGDRAARADRLAADRHPGPRHRRALGRRRGDLAGARGRRGDAAPAQVHVRPRLPRAGGPPRARPRPAHDARPLRPLPRAPRRDPQPRSGGERPASGSPTTSPG